MTTASGLPRPAVCVIPDPDLNAFATGKNPEERSIAVTQGLLDSLNREELQGVIAHDMSHIRNYDIRLMTVIATQVGTVLLLSDWARRTMLYGVGKKRSRNSKGVGQLGLILLIIWIVSIIVAPVVSQLLAMAVSRKREYLADGSAAELTRNPLGLANALRKNRTCRRSDRFHQTWRSSSLYCRPSGEKSKCEGRIRCGVVWDSPTSRETHPRSAGDGIPEAMAYQYERQPKPSR